MSERVPNPKSIILLHRHHRLPVNNLLNQMYPKRVTVQKNAEDSRVEDSIRIRSEQIGLDFGVLFRGAGHDWQDYRHRHHFGPECRCISASQRIC